MAEAFRILLFGDETGDFQDPLHKLYERQKGVKSGFARRSAPTPPLCEETNSTLHECFRSLEKVPGLGLPESNS